MMLLDCTKRQMPLIVKVNAYTKFLPSKVSPKILSNEYQKRAYQKVYTSELYFEVILGIST